MAYGAEFDPMMFLESPWPIITVGIVLEAILAVMLFTTRRGVLLWAVVGVLVLTGGGVLVERLVVTEREQVEMALDDGIAALKSNQLDRVLTVLAPTATDTRRQVEWGYGLVEITGVSLHNIQIEVNDLTSPPTAEVGCDVVIYFRGKSNTITHDRWPGHFTMHYEKHGDRWLVVDPVKGTPLRP
jgi:hypothetical protein